MTASVVQWIRPLCGSSARALYKVEAAMPTALDNFARDIPVRRTYSSTGVSKLWGFPVFSLLLVEVQLGTICVISYLYILAHKPE